MAYIKRGEAKTLAIRLTASGLDAREHHQDEEKRENQSA